jgi:hypothetical protein
MFQNCVFEGEFISLLIVVRGDRLCRDQMALEIMDEPLRLLSHSRLLSQYAAITAHVEIALSTVVQ